VKVSSPADRKANREKVVALIRERPGITKAELKDAARLSSAGVAQNLRRMLNRGEARGSIASGATGYRLADDHNGASASGREDATG
jgi:predicted HTH transcriptional regulator